MSDAEEKDESLTHRSESQQRTTPYRAGAPPPKPDKVVLEESARAALQQRYDLLEELGRGGMGVVFKARDRETGDLVALKVLQPEIAGRPGLIERFKSELLLARKITHKNVCRTFELLRFDSTVVITMEYIDGVSLRAILGSPGGLSLRHAREWVKQICSALAEAHEQGVAHRDLKPENILITRDGVAKVMDFGIARLFESDSTQTGTFVGTPAYMSPEQVDGKSIDARSDIYSLGLVMYEMFTGQLPFQAATPIGYVSKQLHELPPPPRQREPDLPPQIEGLVLKCLEKDPTRRFQTVQEVATALDEVAPPQPMEEKPRPRAPLALGLAGLLGVAVLVGIGIFAWRLLARKEQSPQPLMQFSLDLPSTAPLPAWTQTALRLALSRDGSRLVYLGRGERGVQLFLRQMDQLSPTPLPGTDGGYDPFFSPDGEWVAFFAQGKLKKVSIRDGTMVTLCDAPQGRGGDWTSADMILFTPAFDSGLWRVHASGGTPEMITAPDRSKGESTHRWPQMLPDGDTVLFTVGMLGRSFDDARLSVRSLKTGKQQTLVEGGTFARYSPSGHLLYARETTLLVVPFDPKRPKVDGNPVPLLKDVKVDPSGGAAQFALSELGSLFYIVGEAGVTGSLVWVNRQGSSVPLGAPKFAFSQPRLSPNGQNIAVTIRGSNDDIWIYHLDRGTLTRFTFAPGEDETPIWVQEGERVAFAAHRQGQPSQAFWRAADGSTPEEPLFSSQHHIHLTSWSRNGNQLAYTLYDPETAADIYIASLEGKPQTKPLLRTPFNEFNAVFSPDGRWLAYVSDESGRNEIYVQAFPGPGGRWQISTNGGWEPMWRPDGSELFYATGDSMMAVSMATQPTLVAGTPRQLFRRDYYESYDVSPRGERFLMLNSEADARPTHARLLLNWFGEIQRRVSASVK